MSRSNQTSASGAAGGHHHGARQQQQPKRKLVEIAQVARGRTPLKYEFEVIPFFAGELPSGLDKVCFAWERGSKLFTTTAEAVNPHTRAVFWQQFLKQTCTMYKEGGRMLPKEFSFKVQNVRGADPNNSSRKTIGKVKVDMAQFCTADDVTVPQEVYLQLKPAGKLKLSIKATWLKHAKVDVDALTELSFNTHRSTDAGELEEPGEEQDLSGFDNVDEALAAVRSHSHTAATSSSSPRGSIPAYRAGGDSSGSSPTTSQARAAAAAAGGGESPKNKAGSSKLKPPGLQVAGSTAPFTVGLSPQAEAERAAWLAEERARQEAFQQVESAKLRRTIEDQLRIELNDVLASNSGFSWRSLFCCCLPKQSVQLRATNELGMVGLQQQSSSQLLSPAPLPL